jgi:DNA-binding transcriptional ArsR family regulator
MVTNQDEAGDIFRALADPTRRAILDGLRIGEQPVGNIASGFSVSRPAISKHLRVLREASLVIERKEGRQRIYELNVEPLRYVDDWLNEYRQSWAGKLGRLKRYAESQKPLAKKGERRC